MKVRTLERAAEYLTQQMNHWVFFPLFVTVQGVALSFTGASSPDVLLFALCGVFPLAFFLLREYAERLWLCLFLHILLAASSLLLPASDPVERALAACFGAGYLIHSLVLRFREAGDHAAPIPPAAALGVALPAVLLEHYQGPEDWDFYYTAGLVWVFALSFLISFIRHYLSFVAMNEKSSGCLPAQDMFRSGFGMAAGYTLSASLIVLLGSDLGWLSFLWGHLKRWLLAVLRFLFSLLPQGSEQEGPQAGQALTPEPAPDMGVLEPSQPFFLWRVLEYIAAAAVFLGLFFALGKGIFLLARFLKERFQNRRAGLLQAVGEENEDVREKCGTSSRDPRTGAGKPFFLLSPVERVRRLYRKKVEASSEVLTGGKPGPGLSLLTARECGEKLEAGEMADVYELARYSGQEITKEQLRRMRSACKNSAGARPARERV